MLDRKDTNNLVSGIDVPALAQTSELRWQRLDSELEIPGVDNLRETARAGDTATYVGTERSSGQQVTVTVVTVAPLSADQLDRFRRDFRAAESLNGHPHVAMTHDAGLTGGQQPYLVSEYLPRDLASHLAVAGTIPAMEAAKFGAQVASALAAAHRVGLVHGRVAPDTIRLTDTVTAKLAGFPLGRQASPATIAARTASPYAAPEVRAGGPPGERSDIYSLAAVLRSTLSAQDAHPEGQLMRTLSRALAQDPSARYYSAQEFADELLAFVNRGRTVVLVDGGTALPPPSGPYAGLPPPAASEGKRRKGRIALFGVLGLLVLGGAAATALVLLRDDDSSSSADSAPDTTTTAATTTSVATTPVATTAAGPPVFPFTLEFDRSTGVGSLSGSVASPQAAVMLQFALASIVPQRTDTLKVDGTDSPASQAVIDDALLLIQAMQTNLVHGTLTYDGRFTIEGTYETEENRIAVMSAAEQASVRPEDISLQVSTVALPTTTPATTIAETTTTRRRRRATTTTGEPAATEPPTTETAAPTEAPPTEPPPTAPTPTEAPPTAAPTTVPDPSATTAPAATVPDTSAATTAPATPPSETSPAPGPTT
jgi:hypothetical protein